MKVSPPFDMGVVSEVGLYEVSINREGGIFSRAEKRERFVEQAAAWQYLMKVIRSSSIEHMRISNISLMGVAFKVRHRRPRVGFGVRNSENRYKAPSGLPSSALKYYSVCTVAIEYDNGGHSFYSSTLRMHVASGRQGRIACITLSTHASMRAIFGLTLCARKKCVLLHAETCSTHPWALNVIRICLHHVPLACDTAYFARMLLHAIPISTHASAFDTA